MAASPIVVKVGGSLFDLDDLGDRLRRWVETLSTNHVVLVPGGGAVVDVIRDLDRRHRLGEDACHWLALRALTLNAWLLASMLPPSIAAVVESIEECSLLWRQGQIPILDGHSFARADEGQPGCLPHAWSVTSDSLAVRVAQTSGAQQLILLKSVSIPTTLDWAEAARHGLVDPGFAELVDGTGGRPGSKVRGSCHQFSGVAARALKGTGDHSTLCSYLLRGDAPHYTCCTRSTCASLSARSPISSCLERRRE